MNLEGFQATDIDLSGELGTSDRWILHRLNETIVRITRLLETYDFGETGRLLYDFIWDDLCDWYIEFSKLSLYNSDADAKRSTQSVLAYVLDQTQRMIHPFMPFISEEIWQHLPHEGETISLAAWPVFKPEFVADDAVREMEQLMEVIRSVRNIRAEVNVPMSKKIELLLKPGNSEIEAIYLKNSEYIRRFCNTSLLEINCALITPEKAMTAIVTGVELYLPLAGLIDIAQEIVRLDKELQSLFGEVERIEKKLSNEGFVAKAPVKVIEEEKAKLADYAEKRDKVIARLAELKG
jgi:valyl-tRNA synthetase